MVVHACEAWARMVVVVRGVHADLVVHVVHVVQVVHVGVAWVVHRVAGHRSKGVASKANLCPCLCLCCVQRSLDESPPPAFPKLPLL